MALKHALRTKNYRKVEENRPRNNQFAWKISVRGLLERCSMSVILKFGTFISPCGSLGHPATRIDSREGGVICIQSIDRSFQRYIATAQIFESDGV